MQVTVLYFAAARERTGRDREALELPAGATVAQLQAAIGERHSALAAVLGRMRIAVNQEFAEPGQALGEGDEVAVIPPVAGGVDLARVVARPLDLREVLAAVEGPGRGGVVTFTGTVRADSRGRTVVRLEYEAYAPMAEAKLREIGEQIERTWPGCRIALAHRIGRLEVGEAAVVIAAAAAHRAEAFAACQRAIDRLKAEVPIWKKEVYADGEVWVGMGP